VRAARRSSPNQSLHPRPPSNQSLTTPVPPNPNAHPPIRRQPFIHGAALNPYHYQRNPQTNTFSLTFSPALGLKWRPNATLKMCVCISDAPPHGLGFTRLACFVLLLLIIVLFCAVLTLCK